MGLRRAVTTGTLATLLGAGAALGCECGGYPEILVCDKDIPKPVYTRAYGKGASQVRTYNLRLDLDDDDTYEHMSLAQNSTERIVVGTETQRLGFWNYRVTLRIADGTGRVVSAAYRIDKLSKAEAAIFHLRLPAILAQAHKTGNMRNGLERYLIEEEDAVALDLADEQGSFDRQVRMAEERVCGDSDRGHATADK